MIFAIFCGQLGSPYMAREEELPGVTLRETELKGVGRDAELHGLSGSLVFYGGPQCRKGKQNQKVPWPLPELFLLPPTSG